VRLIVGVTPDLKFWIKAGPKNYFNIFTIYVPGYCLFTERS
jgi:hypothetical protein